MKKILTWAFLVMVLFTLVGCGSGSNTDQTQPKEDEKSSSSTSSQTSTTSQTSTSGGTAKIDGKGKTIGVSSLYTGSDWNAFLPDQIKKDLEAQGFKVVHTNAQGQTRQQVADVENLIQSKVDGIIIGGGEGRAFFDAAAKAKQAGIPLVGVDMYLPDAIASVASDNYTGGTQIGLFLVNAMHGEGKVIILDTVGWQTLIIRKRMATATFAEFPDIKVVGEYEIGVSDPLNQSYNIVKDAIRNNPDIKGVLSTWSLPALGAAKAIKEMGLTKQITVVGTNDGDRASIEGLADPTGPISATIGQAPRKLGSAAADIIAKAATGVKDLPTSVVVPTYLMTNGNPEGAFTELISTSPAQLWDTLHPDIKRPF